MWIWRTTCGKAWSYQYPNHIVTQDLHVWYFSLMDKVKGNFGCECYVKAELGGKPVVIVKAMARGKYKGSVARTHFCIFQLCLKDSDTSSSLCAIEYLPQHRILWERTEFLSSWPLCVWLVQGCGITMETGACRVFSVVLPACLGCRHDEWDFTCINNPCLFGIAHRSELHLHWLGGKDKRPLFILY